MRYYWPWRVLRRLTTVVCNKQEVYADLQFTDTRDGSMWKGKTKVFRFKANPLTYEYSDFIIGFAGSASDIVSVSTFFEFPELHKNPPKVRNLTGLVLTEDAKIYTFDDYTKWLAINQPFAAIGTGAGYALGALESGLSPKEAVKIAMKHDAYTGMGVKGLSW